MRKYKYNKLKWHLYRSSWIDWLKCISFAFIFFFFPCRLFHINLLTTNTVGIRCGVVVMLGLNERKDKRETKPEKLDWCICFKWWHSGAIISYKIFTNPVHGNSTYQRVKKRKKMSKTHLTLSVFSSTCQRCKTRKNQ